VKATEVTTGLAESNGSLLPGLWRDSLHVTCGLTASTPGSAPGPTLGMGKLYLFYSKFVAILADQCHTVPVSRDAADLWPVAQSTVNFNHRLTHSHSNTDTGRHQISGLAEFFVAVTNLPRNTWPPPNFNI